MTIALSLSVSLTPAKVALVVAIYFGLTILPLLLLIRRNVVAGKWTDYDVSDQRQRFRFYSAAIGITAATLLLFFLLGLPRNLVVGVLVGLLLLAIGMAANLRSKLSMHSLFAAYCAMALLLVNVKLSIAMSAILSCVAWSRIVLRRHTPAQVFLGICLGVFGGLVLLLFIAH
jgi:membrane-associated phospholipid phosphatase